jgi:hypothetical protein
MPARAGRYEDKTTGIRLGQELIPLIQIEIHDF